MSKQQLFRDDHTDCPTKRPRTIADFFEKVEVRISDQSGAEDHDSCACLQDVGGNELEARCTQNREVSLEIEQSRALNPSTTIDSGPESVTRIARLQGLLDVGDFVKTSITNEELESVIGSLTDSERYQYLTEHFRPPKGCKYPSTYMNKCNRSFQESWLTKYPWLVYSPKLDGGFCLPCLLFTKNRSGKGVLVNSPFNRWMKVTAILGNHVTLEYHLDCLTKADAFKVPLKTPERVFLVSSTRNWLTAFQETG